MKKQIVFKALFELWHLLERETQVDLISGFRRQQAPGLNPMQLDILEANLKEPHSCKSCVR